VDEDVDSVDDGALEELVLEFDTLLPEVSAPDPLSNSATVHDWTSCTAGLPFASVIGVRVIVHVWVIGPATVCVVCTVCTDCEPPVLLLLPPDCRMTRLVAPAIGIALAKPK
jgi:hypothetical protein